jgi:hypothetical protein
MRLPLPFLKTTKSKKAQPDPPSDSDPLVHPLESQSDDLPSPEAKAKTSPPPSTKTKFFSGWRRTVILVLGGILLFFIIVGGILAVIFYPKAKALSSSVNHTLYQTDQLQAAIRSQDLTQVSQSLDDLDSALTQTQADVDKFSFLSGLPKSKDYWQDQQHLFAAAHAGIQAGQITVTALEPYADLLGLKSDLVATDSAAPSETTKDRITFVVETIDKITPQLDTISQQVNAIRSELSQVDPARYPENFRGIAVRSQLTELTQLADQASFLLSDARPLLESAPYLLGNDTPRTYLFLFQNDAELRPTGGFLTAYSLIEINRGQIKPLLSNDIYALDARFTPPEAPRPILKYLPKVDRWHLRDMNLSPDFKVSMDTFYEHYQKTVPPKIDGIVAVDTQMLLKLLEVLGTIGVSGYGNFGPEIVEQCNCPQVIYELELFADVETPYIRENRKSILGPLMNSVLRNAFQSPKAKMPGLVNAGLTSIKEKHLLVYLLDEQAQAAAEAFNLAGRILPTDGDYLHINDTNFAGAKSNMYVNHEVELQTQISESGSVKHTLNLTYKNPQAHDNWLNADFRDFLRIYVPQGSQLLDSQGSEIEVITYDELGKTVFEAFFVVRPMGVAKLSFTYELPSDLTFTDQYNLLIQKQGGSKNHLYTVSAGDQTEEFDLDGDRELTFDL